MTYVVVTLVVLILLNIYCSNISQMVFYQSKEASMLSKCQLAADEIAGLEVINSSTISSVLSDMDSLKVSRLIVTDQAGRVLFDNLSTPRNQYALLPEILTALGRNDVFTYYYRDGVMTSKAATPVVYYDTIVGCVYMTEYDAAQGRLIHSLQITIFQVTFILELVLIVFALFFSSAFSRRMRKIMRSMRIIQEGD